jgi:DNA-binding ferritin-like protein
MKTISRTNIFSNAPVKSAEYPETSSTSSLEKMTAACVTELMNAAVSFHKLHLKVTGIGSHASHTALNELYDALPDHADTLAEGFQGASEKLLECIDTAPRMLSDVPSAIVYLREMHTMVTTLQSKMPYSEIANDLDNIKSTINSIKYKLIFLK